MNWLIKPNNSNSLISCSQRYYDFCLWVVARCSRCQSADCECGCIDDVGYW